MSVIKLSNGIFLLRDEESKVGAFVDILPKSIDIGHGADIVPRFNTDVLEHIKWGEKDDKPNVMHKLATENDVKWPLMFTKRDFIVGKGLKYGFERKEGQVTIFEELPSTHPNYNEISEHDWALNLSGYWIDAAMQTSFAGNIFSRIELDSRGRALPLSLEDAMSTRYRTLRENERQPSAFLLNGLFGTRFYQKKDSEPIPAFDLMNPRAFPVSLYHAKHRLPGNPFYAFPGWWGTKSWTEVANKIPVYHLSGLTNGYNIKYLIKLPDDYFDKDGLETEEEKEMFQMQVLQQMKKSLAGESDRAIVTYYKHDLVEMKSLPGVEIIPLKNTMTDDAYVQLYNTAKGAQASGHDVLSVLAGVDTGGKLGGSGKELEVAANFQQKFRTASDRALLLRPMLIVQRLNGWDKNIKFWFDDIEVYTPDVTPKKAAVNENANSNNADQQN